MKTKITMCMAAFVLAGFSAFAQVPDQLLNEYSQCTGGGVNNGLSFGDSYYNTFFGVEAGRNIINKEKGRNNTFVGHQAGFSTVGNTTTGNDNTLLGFNAGYSNVSGNNNVFLGSSAGILNTASDNTFIGFASGRLNSTGTANIFIGSNAGFSNTLAGYNIFVGFQSGYLTNTGSANVFMGHGSGMGNTSGWGNTYLGFSAGSTATGSQNVFLGNNAGANETGSGKLFVDVSNTAQPLLWGDFYNREVKLNGKVGIGGTTTNPFGAFPTTAGGVNVQNYNLFVKGGILTEEVRVNLTSGGAWADYVFEENYDLKPLSEVEKFIAENRHLPNVPSAAEVKRDGIELGNMAKIQQEKIEELTLYLIQQQKEIDELRAQLKSLISKQ